MFARLAHADDDPVTMTPGTFGDPAHDLELSPSFLLVPADDVPAGIAIRDADPTRVKIFVDGFAVPNQLVNGRSVFFGSDVSQFRAFDNGMDLGYGGTTGGGLEITTRDPSTSWMTLAATPQDASATFGDRLLTGGVRFGFLEAQRGHPIDLAWNDHLDLQYRFRWRLSRHWQLALSAFGTLVTDASFARDTLTASYRDSDTSAILAVSALQLRTNGPLTLDARADLRHTVKDVAGLPALEMRGGASMSTNDTGTQFDGGAWASLGANLAKNVVALGGARLDVFDQQVALSPRGLVAAMFGDVGVAVSASTYRQAQLDRDATPERATEIAATVSRPWIVGHASLIGYYIDRSRIMVDGRATGVGTAQGLEAREQVHQGAWRVQLAFAYSQATRADRLTAADHPADLDIPYRFDLLVQWRHGDWLVGGRAQLRSGLPYTPVAGAVYDTDTDTYSALYGKPNSESAPWRHELDLRVDRQLLPHLHAYLDVAIDGGTLGYTYGYDYSQQLAVRAPPILPWLGITGTL